MPVQTNLKCDNGKTQFNIKNIDCDMFKKFREIASKNHRGIGNEIIILMENHVKQYKDTK